MLELADTHLQHGLGWSQMGSWRFLFRANLDLADILGRTDLYFENSIFLACLDSKFLDFQVSRFPKFGPWPELAPGQAGLEPSGPKNVDF